MEGLDYIGEKVKEIAPEIVKWRRTLHQFPETGNNTKKTSEYIKMQLDEMKISYKTMVNDCGIVALIGNKIGKCVALRADIDGLPICEKTGLSFASKNGNMHACGHDSHAAMALGTAKVLKSIEKNIPGQVKILFQPGEETVSGAKAMIEEGCLEDPRPDAIIALHSMPVEGLENGSILVTYGAQSASCDSFEIMVKGKGGHAAEPHKCVDVITTICEIVDALQKIVSREVPPFKDALLSVTGIQAGSEAYNVMPNVAEIRGTYRTHDNEVRDLITRRIRGISEDIASAMNAIAEVKILEGVPTLINDNNIVDVVKEAYQEVEDHKEIRDLPPHMGGEDAALYFNEIPGAYFMLSDAKKVGDQYYPAHNCRFDLDDSVLYIGTETSVRTLLKLLQK